MRLRANSMKKKEKGRREGKKIEEIVILKPLDMSKLSVNSLFNFIFSV